MGLPRSKLFLSYSRGDADWRERFIKHLKTMFLVDKELWVDLESIRSGEGWRQEIIQGAAESRCALLLVTPNYLDKSQFAHEELAILAKEQPCGLKLLPVLVEPCSWDVMPALSGLQFVRWQNATIEEQTTGGSREVLRSIREAGSDDEIDRAVIRVCETVRKELGVLAQTTSEQRDDLLDSARRSLARSNVQLEDAVHSGDFCVIYRGRWQAETVAVKVVPDAARRNRVRALFDSTLTRIEDLRDPAFIRVHFHIVDSEPHSVVMEYVDWPTLEERLGEQPHRRLPAPIVARILSTLARAQGEAHKYEVHLGPLSPANIHVGDNWDVRISPIRLKGQLARVAGLTSGQLINWDMLTTLSPESCDGLFPEAPEGLNRHEQYYLGLLGLELLLGRRPFEVRRFADFKIKEQFFENPRSFFGYGTEEGCWTETEPAMAVVLATLLARDPAHRFESADTAVKELAAIDKGALPYCVRRCVEKDMDLIGTEAFAAGFYRRLFQRRGELEDRFRDRHAQPKKLAAALQDLIEFRPDAIRSRFGTLAREHAAYQLAPADYDAFRQAFVEEVAATASCGAVTGDAWKAVLTMGLRVMNELAQSAPMGHGTRKC